MNYKKSSELAKKQIVEFVRRYNRKHGFGGRDAAKRRYGLHPLLLKKWCIEAGYTDADEAADRVKFLRVSDTPAVVDGNR